ncbi:hypothetical protein Ancab_001472, partial [Ancistrocladus abbreviatus]
APIMHFRVDNSTQKMNEAKQNPSCSRDNQKSFADTGLGNTITDSSIENVNRIFLQRQAKSNAVEVWEFGKKLGATFEGEEMEIVNRLTLIEEKDSLVGIRGKELMHPGRKSSRSQDK